MAYTVAVKDKGGNWQRFTVPYEVYAYIMQLETYIRHPDESKLFEVYGDRLLASPNQTL